MFITRRRLEEIKAHERWEHESRLNREREMTDMCQRLDKLEYKVAMLEKEKNGVNPAENIPVTYTATPF